MRTLAVPVEDDVDEALDAISARTGWGKTDLLGAAIRYYVRLEQRFQELAATWRRETAHLSSIAARAAHPTYQEIIAMGDVARQLSDEWWTSKCGGLEDIRHPLSALEGEEYGTVVAVLRRPMPSAAAVVRLP